MLCQVKATISQVEFSQGEQLVLTSGSPALGSLFLITEKGFVVVKIWKLSVSFLSLSPLSLPPPTPDPSF